MSTPRTVDEFGAINVTPSQLPNAVRLIAGPGSWDNPRIRARDGVATRATTVHLPITLAQQLDEVRIRSHRRLSDLLTEAAREWLERR